MRNYMSDSPLSDPANLKIVIQELASLDFFKFVPKSEIARLKTGTARALTENNDLWNHFDNSHELEFWSAELRYFPADAEFLAEAGIGDVIREMIPVLRKEGLEITSLTDEPFCDEATTQSSYHLVVNGVRHTIFDSQVSEDADFWGISHKRTADILNDLLQSVGSTERVYGNGHNNDAGFQILNDRLFQYISTLPLSPWWKPFKF